ncbi:hypothetical protein CH375_04980 [Leptospira ellisii]|uniref:Uncharacterized protein n=1 Tax=Leptospira ellisii TaxID=2023197 RepID=A0A2N0BND4_9LEPT|nr:hypothetical protein CH379_21560 [Leptospira ellisii]PKA05473.1 hypothetical protein CH375_04980 [Leptospira ellisii]
MKIPLRWMRVFRTNFPFGRIRSFRKEFLSVNGNLTKGFSKRKEEVRVFTNFVSLRNLLPLDSFCE